MGCRVYLRVAIGALNAVFVIITGLTALLVTSLVSLDTLNTNGDRHVLALGNAATAKVDTFFVSMQHVTRGATEMARMRDNFAFPSEHITRTWTDAALVDADLPPGGAGIKDLETMWWALSSEVDWKPLAVLFWLFDGTRVASLPLIQYPPYLVTEVMFQNRTTSPIPFASPPLDRHYYGINPVSRTYFDPATQPGVGQWAALRNKLSPRIDMRYPPVQQTLAPFTNFTPGAAPSWAPARYIHDNMDILYTMSIGVMYNRTNTALGYIVVMVSLNGIGASLDAVRPTASTVIAVVDKAGYLLGGTTGIDVFNTTDINTTIVTSAPAGCSSTEESKATVPSSKDAMACRHHGSNSNNAVLRKMANAQMMGTHNLQTKITTGGETYYVRVQRLEEVTLEAFVVVIVPEADILGDVQRTIMIAAVSTAAVVLVAALLSFFFVWAMLHPLQGIAVRMGKAARLEEDPAEVDDSMLVEIGDLQRAFKEMRDELSRIRAFVPQSLLRASTSEDEDDFYDADLHADGSNTDVTHMSSARLSSRQHPSSGAMSGGGINREMSSTDLSSAQSAAQFSSGQLSGQQMSSLQLSATAMSGAINVRSQPHSPPSPQPRSGALYKEDTGSPSPWNRSRPTSETTSRTGTASQSVRATRKRHGPKLGGARIMSGVKTDNVSVLVVNLRGYHDAVQGGIAAKKVAATVSCVMRAADSEKGVVDSFHGDRFSISFNAVRPAANHGIRAAVAAARVVAGIASSSDGYALPVSCGVATGLAQVGNLGSDTMKRFSIVGPVVSQATVLERLCKLHPAAQCLVPQRLFEDLRTAVQLRTVDYVQLPFAKGPCLIADVVQEHKQSDANDEWMYQLQGQQDAGAAAAGRSPYGLINEAWDAAVRGERSTVVKIVEALKAQDTHMLPVAVEAAIARLGECAAEMTTGALKPASLGKFYDVGVCSAVWA